MRKHKRSMQLSWLADPVYEVSIAAQHAIIARNHIRRHIELRKSCSVTDVLPSVARRQTSCTDNLVSKT